MSENKIEKSAGLFLKETRVAKNLSLEEVSKHTRIHPNILKSIEQDDYKNLGGVYAKGFLKLYAEYLGLDKDDIIRRFQSFSLANEAPSGRRVRIPGDEQHIKTPSLLLSVSKVFDIFKKINFKFIGGLIVILVIAWGIVWLARHHKPVHRVIKKEEVSRASFNRKGSVGARTIFLKGVPKEGITLKTAEPKGEPLSKPLAGVVAVKENIPTQTPEKIILVIRAKDKCWLVVRVDGKVEFQGMLDKKNTGTWQANDKIELAVGNAGNIELELNGKLLQKIGRPRQSLKHVVVTRLGLSIQK